MISMIKWLNIVKLISILESKNTPLLILINTFDAILRHSRIFPDRIDDVITALISLLTNIGRMHLPKMNSPIKPLRSYVLISGNY